MPTVRGNGMGVTVPRNVTSTTYVTSSQGFTTSMPTIGNYWGDCTGNIDQNSILNASKCAKGHVTNANPVLTSSDLNGGSLSPNVTCMQASLSTLGYANNIRA